jgi:hypothetical protein
MGVIGSGINDIYTPRQNVTNYVRVCVSNDTVFDISESTYENVVYVSYNIQNAFRSESKCDFLNTRHSGILKHHFPQKALLTIQPVSFDYLSSLSSIERSIEEDITDLVDSLDNCSYAYRLKKRLLDLVATDELEEGEDALALGSIKHFIGFVKAFHVKYPDIVITMRGNVKAEWRHGNDKLFAVEFFPSGDCKFITFVPNANNPAKVDRMSGYATTDTVLTHVDMSIKKDLVVNG